MARFRLRFLLQEFDLRGSEVILGRSPECHITIEDPLVSRQHAQILIQNDVAKIQDLGSRNGVIVNGKTLKGSRVLKDGDRIRLGAQELVFHFAKSTKRETKTTGFMTMCNACGTPFPERSPQCPHCGAAKQQDDTISGLVVEPRRSWTFQLLGEVIERALDSGRAPEAERMLRRAAREVDERLAAGERLDRTQVDSITGFAVDLAILQGSAEWVYWALNVHRHQAIFPANGLIERLEEIDYRKLPEAREYVDEFSEWVRNETQKLRPPPKEDLIDRLSQLTKVSTTV